MRIFDSKYYPKVMYLALVIVTLLILFNVVNILDSANYKLHERTIAGFAIENQSDNQTGINNSFQGKGELHSANSYFMYYILLIGILAAIFITFTQLRSTIMKNIELEEKRYDW
jgi:hypothetical protein